MLRKWLRSYCQNIPLTDSLSFKSSQQYWEMKPYLNFIDDGEMTKSKGLAHHRPIFGLKATKDIPNIMIMIFQMGRLPMCSYLEFNHCNY